VEWEEEDIPTEEEPEIEEEELTESTEDEEN